MVDGKYVFSNYRLYSNDLRKINETNVEEFEKEIKRKLVLQLAEYIIEHFEELPMHFTIDTFPYNKEQLIMVKLNLLSDEEIEKLNKLEKQLKEIGGILK